MNEEIIARAGEFIATTRDCILALIDADGFKTQRYSLYVDGTQARGTL